MFRYQKSEVTADKFEAGNFIQVQIDCDEAK